MKVFIAIALIVAVLLIAFLEADASIISGNIRGQNRNSQKDEKFERLVNVVAEKVLEKLGVEGSLSDSYSLKGGKGSSSPSFKLQLQGNPVPGSVSYLQVSPSGSSCGTDCFSFSEGTQVTVYPFNMGDYRFQRWEGECEGSSSCTVIMDSDKTLQVVFTHGKVLRITIEGKGIVSDPDTGDVLCTSQSAEGNFCEAVVQHSGSYKQIKSQDDFGYIFQVWSNGCYGTGTTCNLHMNTNPKSFTAKFIPDPGAYVLTVMSHNGRTTTNSNVGGTGKAISCQTGFITGGPCEIQDVPKGSVVTFTAQAHENYEFSHWQTGDEGCNQSKEPTCTITMARPTLMHAIFVYIGTPYYSFSVSKPFTSSVAVNGKVYKDSWISGPYTFYEGTEVTVEAFDADGHKFVRYSGGACNGVTSRVCTFVMTGSGLSTTAVFE